MRPPSGTVSASSLLTWEQCPQQFVAKYIKYIPQITGSTRGMVGTVCHGAMERFVQAVYFAKTHSWDDINYLMALVGEEFVKVYQSANKSSEDFKDARKLVRDWHERTDLSDVEVISTEEKVRTPTMVDDILLTYIFDRCDLTLSPSGEKAIRVVDYKSVAQRWGYDDVKTKLQFRIYALCAMIQFKEMQPTGVWVAADLLRHNELIEVFITREECIETWNYIQETVQLILDTDEDDAPYRLGTGCRFCPVQATCPALQEHVDAGGNLSISSPEEAVILHEQMKGKLEGLKSLIAHTEKIITDYARETDVTKISAKDDTGKEITVSISSTGRREITNPAAVAKIIGPAMAARIGKFTLGDLDKLMNGNELTQQQKDEIETMINKNWSPKLTFKQKGQ
ncbi:RecB-like exonuclease [Gordonia phage Camerico]|nr:RecB-like exonuclease [Gordonia phage Camerico]